ncbi:hypothetical protein L6452_14584 [Arctium lappa]|uniref:Uncharacterized protein n=1 Tax=Arctium lappa TaxID=4217 RepID=A0ACB9CLG1_ARCLA|nr:hypothetical protein L6452_14584 [Arctium lappa]
MVVFALSMVVLLAIAGYSSADYCVCNSGSSDAVLQNGACFNPNTAQQHHLARGNFCLLCWNPRFLTLYTVANGVLGLVVGVITRLVVDMAFLVQANMTDELPEGLIGAVRVSHLELSSAIVPELEPDPESSQLTLQASNNNKVRESM